MTAESAPKDFFAGKRVLLTGAGGYIGHAVSRALADTDCTLVRLRRREAALMPLHGNCVTEDVRADLTDDSADLGAWKRWLRGVDVVLHLAGQTSAVQSDLYPEEDWRINVRPLLRLCRAAKDMDEVPVVVFAGTVTQIGLSDDAPVNEGHPHRPMTTYDVHKLSAENHLLLHSLAGDVSGVSLRLPNIYGPGPKSGNSDRGILNMMMRRALGGEPLTVYGDGAPVRDYLYVEDAARAFLAAAMAIDVTQGRYFVIGTGEGYSLAEAMGVVAKRSEMVTGRKVELHHIDPPGDLPSIEQRNFIADYSAFSEAAGWSPEWRLEAGVDRTIASMLEAGNGK